MGVAVGVPEVLKVLLLFTPHIGPHHRRTAVVNQITEIPPLAVHGAQSGDRSAGGLRQMNAPAEATNGIRQVARDLLRRGIEDLVEASADLISGEEPSYGDAHVAHSDLARQTHRTLSLTLYRLADLKVPEELSTAAYETGLRRAEQGLPLASLLHAFRIDLRLLWDTITEEVRGLEDLERLTVLEQHTLLWEALEANTADVVKAYRVVETRQAQRLDQRDRELFKRFVTTAERQPDTLATFAAQTTLQIDGHYTAFVVTGLSDPRETAAVLRARLRDNHFRSFVTVYKEDVHGLARARDGLGPRAELLADNSGEGSVAVVPAMGLSSVPRALRVAREVATARQPGSFANVGEQPFEQLAALEPETVDAILDYRLRGLSVLTTAEMAGIWETLEALFAGDGTVTDIAARTYRHRNTIRGRIDKLRELTGLNSRVPADLAVLALAVARRRTATVYNS